MSNKNELENMPVGVNNFMAKLINEMECGIPGNVLLATSLMVLINNILKEVESFHKYFIEVMAKQDSHEKH